MIEMTLGVLLGGVITILVAAAVENLKRPRLRIDIASPDDVTYEPKPEHPASKVRYLRVIVTHLRLPWWARWTIRNTAAQCTGTITFHHLNDGTDRFGRSMPIRWSGVPAPLPTFIFNRKGEMWGQIAPQTIVDSFVDIPAGESRTT